MTVRTATRATARDHLVVAWRRVPLGAIALYAVALAVVIFLAAPIVAIIIMSFNAGDYIRFPPIGFSLKWYGRMWQMPGFVDSLALSLQLAAQVMALSVVLGVAAALGLARGSFPGRSAIIAALMSPLVVPTIVTGLALYQFFLSQDLRSAGWNLVAGHVIITIPYVARTVLASLEVFDWSLVDTARVLGAGPVRAFWRVTLPTIKPGVLAGGIFAFLVSFDNVTVSLFLRDAVLAPLPVQVLNYIENIFDPSIAALSAVLIYGSMVILILADRMVGAGRLRGL